MVLYRRDDIVEDQYLQKVALDHSVPYQIDPKTIPKERQAFTVGRYAFPGNNECYPAYQYDRRYRY